MNDNDPRSVFSVAIEYDDSMSRKIREGTHNPLSGITLRTDRESLPRGDDVALSAYLHSFLYELATSVLHVVAGQPYAFSASDGPAYVAVEPITTDAVRITQCYSRSTALHPDERSEDEASLTVRQAAFVEETIDAGTTFRDFVNSTNTALTDELRQFEWHLETAKTVSSQFQSRPNGESHGR
ncbi:hypothetical protein HTZ84_17285 [Haloterrigena sp. SYSU A558-1]|uniref:Uncharacterized protein n=1 Tax=Haloterrigena gelatinilytica TaxID=2741724 RepID=A0A8J8GKQ2_9EURY|nr:hypothetical protein [Haloterrigena gelatinilytica]NUB90144.1 hypothetical protein [Haloterrigena gelatinilytica]NUC74034.1 hypothetical protein [Haloterrigena gelatinilytica]